MKMNESRASKIFDICNYAFLLILCLLMVLPFVHIAAKSLSKEAYVMGRQVTLWPKGFNLNAYKYVFSMSQTTKSLFNSMFVTIVGTILSMIVSIMAAYPLSRKRVPFVSFLMFLYVFVMYFHGGMIPTYLVVKGLSLTNTLWALILPATIIPYNLILLKTFFQSIPDSMEESARIDGASYYRILFTIYVPLAKPSIATLSMFYAVRYWNDYFMALLYITKRKLYPLQLFLRDIIIEGPDVEEVGLLVDTSPETLKAVIIIVALVPILMIYPLVQQYFVKGIMIGAVKG